MTITILVLSFIISVIISLIFIDPSREPKMNKEIKDGKFSLNTILSLYLLRIFMSIILTVPLVFVMKFIFEFWIIIIPLLIMGLLIVLVLSTDSLKVAITNFEKRIIALRNMKIQIQKDTSE